MTAVGAHISEVRPALPRLWRAVEIVAWHCRLCAHDRAIRSTILLRPSQSAFERLLPFE